MAETLEDQEREKWLTAYRKALRHYGKRQQAIRIAWGAIDRIEPKPRKRTP